MSTKEYNLVMCQDSDDPDPELLAWEKWIKIRKEETEHLAHKTGRAPGELTMNLCAKVREKKEEKIVLENAQIVKKVGVRRALWDRPDRLKQTCACKPVYEAHRTKVELGRPGIIQHVGIPRHIQEMEMGISGSQRRTFMKLDSEYMSYKKKREKDLEETIKIIDPYRPNLQDLIVIGSKPKSLPIKLPSLPKITFSSNDEPPEDILTTVYAVRINDTIFYKNIPNQSLDHLKKMRNDYGHEKCDSWSYYFNSPVSRVGRSKLYLQNLGTVTLRYCWKKIKQIDADESQHQVFFFNKNENVIYPGQTQEVFFTFMSKEVGTYEESWQLVFMNVCFFDSPEKQIIFNFYADSMENLAKIKRKAEKLENFIYVNVLTNIARDLIGEIIIKATSVEPQIYPYEKLFLEADLFVMKNPVCFYHQTEVMKMKDMYAEMVPGENWDLSINTWRAAMIGKGFDERMKYYDTLRHSYRELLKPWYEENDLSELKEATQKYKAVYQTLGQLADKFDKEYERIPVEFYNTSREQRESNTSLMNEKLLLYAKSAVVHHIFYLRIYEHLGTAIELCAGLLSSLDLNRWIQFDFCRT